MCVNTKTTYKTKTDTKGNTKWKQTHSKDKFLNLNSDPNVGLPTSRVFGTLLRDRERETVRAKERERESEMVSISVTNVFNLAEHKKRNPKIQFSNVLFRQHFDLVAAFFSPSRFEYFTHLPFDFLDIRLVGFGFSGLL